MRKKGEKSEQSKGFKVYLNHIDQDNTLRH